MCFKSKIWVKALAAKKLFERMDSLKKEEFDKGNLCGFQNQTIADVKKKFNKS